MNLSLPIRALVRASMSTWVAAYRQRLQLCDETKAVAECGVERGYESIEVDVHVGRGSIDPLRLLRPENHHRLCVGPISNDTCSLFCAWLLDWCSTNP